MGQQVTEKACNLLAVFGRIQPIKLPACIDTECLQQLNGGGCKLIKTVDAIIIQIREQQTVQPRGQSVNQLPVAL